MKIVIRSFLLCLVLTGVAQAGGTGSPMLLTDYEIGPNKFVIGSPNGVTIGPPSFVDSSLVTQWDVSGSNCTSASAASYLFVSVDDPNYKLIVAQVMFAIATNRPVALKYNNAECLPTYWNAPPMVVANGIKVSADPAE